jgi:PAS domain S-box-containing protein
MPTPLKPPTFPKWLAALLALAAVAVLLSGYVFLRAQTLQAQAELSGTGLVLALVFVLLAGMVGVAWTVWQQAQKRYYQAAYTAGQARLALTRHFEYQVKYANDIILLADADLHLVEANDRAVETYGYSREEMLRLAIPDLVAPEDAAGFRSRQAALQANGTVRAETLHRRRDGSVFPVEVSARLIPVEGRTYYQGIYRDMTERVRTEQARQQAERKVQEQNEQLQVQNEELTAQREELQSQNEELRAQQEELQQTEMGLRESETRFRALFEGAQEGIAVYAACDEGADFIFHDFNRQAEQIEKTDRAGVLGRRVTEVFPGVRGMGLFDVFRRVWQTGQPENHPVAWYQDGSLAGWRENYVFKLPSGEIVATYADRTAQKQAEEALHDNQAILAAAEKAAHIGSWRWDLRTRKVTWSDEMFRLFGIDPAEFDGAVEQVVQTRVHPEDLAAVERANLTLLQDHKPTPLEYRLRLPDGTERIVWAEGQLSYDQTGQAVALTGYVQDITAQKRAEDRLQQALERLDLATHAARLGIWDWDIPRNKLVWDDRMYELYGVQRADFPGAYEAWLAGLHPADRAASDEVSRQAQRGEREYDTEFRVLWPDGTVRMLKAHGQFVRDAAGQPVRMTGVSYDITEQKWAEEALRESEEKFSKAFQTAPYAVTITRARDGRIIEVNDTFISITGFTRAEAVGDSSINLNLWLNIEDRDSVLLALKNGRMVKDREFQFGVKNGGHITGLFSSQIIHIADEPFILSSIADITERKQTELFIQAQQEQLVAQNEELTAQNEELAAQGHALAEAEATLQEMNTELEQRIQARTAELQHANAELVYANRLKDEFLANMSHELRTPLTGILGLTEVMEQGIYGGLSEKQRQALHLVQASGEHLLHLINDILDLSKVEAGKVDLQIAPVLVEDLCRASLEFVKQTAHKKNLQLIFQPDAQVRQVQADERRLKQMLVNLLSNAVKFTPEGGQVGLEVTGGAAAGDPTRQQVHFTVWDTGIGIALEQQALLFQPFVQLDGSLARKYEGTGLGLALVHSMAKLHGGSVTVESAGLGQGARFTLTLPWVPQPVSPAPTATDTAEPISRLVSLAAVLGRPPVVLAVDDNPTSLMVFTSFLEALGCQIITAQNGAEALAQAEATRPDLILLDIHMPDIDGLTVVRRLRAVGSAVPVIALTALAMPEDRKLCLAAGANDYLSKPVSLNELARTIARQLELREL